MSKSKIMRISAFVGGVGLTAALVGAGVAGTGAYFTDTADGSVSNSFGTIKVNTDGTAISFDKMLPGSTSAKSVAFANSGDSAQDVWIVFDGSTLGDGDKTTSGKINDLGQYAQVEIKSGGDTIFFSGNLNDDADSCPVGAGPDPVCQPVPKKLKLASNLAPGAGGAMEFAFTPSARFQTQYPSAFAPLNYKIVATQPGIDPLDGNNKPITFP